MEVNQQNLQTLSQALAASLSVNAAERKQAEAFLMGARSQPGYASLLFAFFMNDQAPPNQRHSAAVQFKNTVKENWESGVTEEEKASIRSQLVGAMLQCPVGALRKLLSEALTLISRSDFPHKWADLPAELIGRCAATDLALTAEVMHTLHLVFKRYRNAYKTDDVVRELLHILKVVFEPLQQMFQAVIGNVAQGDPVAFRLLLNCVKVFYDLNYVDLPEQFEDAMPQFMTGFLTLLKADATSVALNGDDDELPGLQQKVQSNVCRCISLYATKYDEEFQPYLQGFTQATWELTTRSLQRNLGRYDQVIAQGIAFLTAVANGAFHSVFASGDILRSICEKIVIPAMTLRDEDVEMFEDSPNEYIQRDIEGGDTDTRRRSAQELVKALRRNYEEQTTQLFGGYIQTLIGQYAANPAQAWRAKDVAIYLMTALTITQFRRNAGTTKINPLVPLVPFYEEQVRPLLTGAENAHPVLLADALKFVFTFRLQLTPAHYAQFLQPLVQHLLGHQVWVVHTYAAFALEKLIMIREANASGVVESRIPPAQLATMLEAIFGHLFAKLKQHINSPNVYVMRCLMRVIGHAQQAVVPGHQMVLQNLTELLRQVALNPQRPLFNHYLFESIAVLIRSVCTGNEGAVAAFDAALHPIFEQIITQDVMDFLPYSFQILAQLVHLHPQVDDAYWRIFQLVIDQSQWERSGNVPALITLLSAYIARGGQSISANQQQMQAIMWIWQKLNASPKYDADSAHLLRGLVRYLPLPVLDQYLPQVLTLIFKRLSMPKGKTPNYVRGFVVWCLFFSATHGGDELHKRCEAVQQGIFNNVLQLIVNNLQRVNERIERKYSALGAIKLLCNSNVILQPEYSAAATPLLSAIIAFFELPEQHDDVEDTLTDGEESNYSRLRQASAADEDPFPQVKVPQLQLAASFAELKSRSPQAASHILSQLPPDPKAKLQGYFQTANIAL